MVGQAVIKFHSISHKVGSTEPSKGCVQLFPLSGLLLIDVFSLHVCRYILTRMHFLLKYVCGGMDGQYFVLAEEGSTGRHISNTLHGAEGLLLK